MSKEQQDPILEWILNPDTRADGFESLIKTYRELLYWHIRRLVVSHEDAEDALQNTFMNVYRSIDTFRRDSSLRTWLYKIATNEALTILRNRKLEYTSYDNEACEQLIDRLYADNEIDGDNILLKFQEAILRLPPKQQLVFNLRYYDEMSYEEISQLTGTSVGSLKTGYHYAAEKIKKYMMDSQI